MNLFIMMEIFLIGVSSPNGAENQIDKKGGDCENYMHDTYYEDLDEMRKKENKRSCATTTFLLSIDIFTIALIVLLFSKITIKNGTRNHYHYLDCLVFYLAIFINKCIHVQSF